MTEETKTTTTEASTGEVKKTFAPGGFRKPFNKDGKGPRKDGGKGGFRDKPKAEFDQKVLDVRRVTRVVSGGRRYSLAVALAIGDKKGNVGIGTGKGLDTQLAMDKAYRAAMKNLVTLKLSKTLSIPHDLDGKFNSCRIKMFPNKGRGLIAGSSARIILNLAGVQNITAKFHSPSKNKLNNGRATMNALSLISVPFVRQPKKDFGPSEGGERRGGFNRDGQGRGGERRGPSKTFVRRPFNKDLRNPQVAPAVETKVETSTPSAN
jgi:small subunit ribosomal protein S5